MADDAESKEYEERLRRRLKILAEQMEQGKISFAEHLAEEITKSLEAVKVDSNGVVDLSTVDGRIRSMALAVEFGAYREEAKEVASLQDISSNFFDFIEQNVGWIADEAAKLEFDAGEASHAMSNHPEFVAKVAPNIEGFLGVLEEFWDSVADGTHFNIQDLTGSKAVFGGDLFPSYTSNLCSTAGIYVDTIVLTDPFYQSRHIFRSGDAQSQVRYLVKHAVNLLSYREVVRANVAVPMIAFAPFRSSIDKEEQEYLQNIAERDGLKHASRTFGRDFDSADELFAYVAEFKDIDSLVNSVSDEKRVLFNLDDEGTLAEKISAAFEGELRHMIPEGMSVGAFVAINGISRMGQATDVLMKSTYLGGTPLIQAETSWQYFKWKLEYNSVSSPDDDMPMHMSQGLMRAAETDEVWLKNIPVDALIEMRTSGAFEEVRNVLSQGVSELALTNPSNFFRTSDQIVDNIRAAFDEHQAELKELTSRKIKFAGHDICAMVGAAALDLTAIASGIPSVGAASWAANQALDLPKWKEVPSRFKEIRDDERGLKQSPMGLFLAHKDE